MPVPGDALRTTLRAALILAAFVVIVAGGLFLGEWSAPEYAPALPEGMVLPGSEDDADAAIAAYTPEPDAPPLAFYPGTGLQDPQNLVYEEIALSAQAGVHRYWTPVRAPWNGGEEVDDILAVLRNVVQTDASASFMLVVDLNPPAAWIQANPQAAVLLGGENRAIPCAVSEDWRAGARQALQTLTEGIQRSPFASRVAGYELCALERGQWRYGGVDMSPANLNAFRAWLAGVYKNVDDMRAAWNDPSVSFPSVDIPALPDAQESGTVFFDLPKDRPAVDFLTFTSESRGDSIAGLAMHLRMITSSETLIYVPYGYSYEFLQNESGHFALGLLLESEVDGFVSPVSNVDRGLGGAGGFMGPVDSAYFHSKRWCFVDDTRTGLSRDAASGTLVRIKGLHPEDVYNVQRRNFAAALVHGMELVWTDPAGEGWLLDRTQWSRFKQMREVMSRLKKEEESPAPVEPAVENTEAVSPEETAALPAEPPLPEEMPAESLPPVAGDTPPPPVIEYDTGLVVVVDESSRFVARDNDTLNEVLLHGNRDAAIRVGVAAEYCLLQDVLDGVSPLAPVYLFLNAFAVSASERERLHQRLAVEKACALWVYAPGFYDGDKTDLKNIAATTGMAVKAFDGAASTGSAFMLSGRWMNQDERYGEPMRLNPLFYIEDSEADVLCRFMPSGKSSVAMRSFDTGWTSIFFADPAVTPELLREMLLILEQQVYLRPTANDSSDAAHINRDILAVHGRRAGEREISLGKLCDVEDLFDPAMRWSDTESFMLPLRTGETRVLRVRPR